MECLKDKTGWRLLLGRVQGCGFCMYHMFRVWGYSCLNKKNGWPLFFWNVPHTHFLNPNSALLYLLSELQYISPSPVPSLPIHPVYTTTIYFPKAQIQSPHFPTWCFFHSAVSSPQCSNQDLYRSTSYPHLQASLLVVIPTDSNFSKYHALPHFCVSVHGISYFFLLWSTKKIPTHPSRPNQTMVFSFVKFLSGP